MIRRPPRSPLFPYTTLFPIYDRASRHDSTADQDQMMCRAPGAKRPIEHPPKPEANRPKEIEVLRRVGAVGIRAELGFRARVDACLHEKKQLALALKPLRNAFQPEQRPVQSQHP